MSPTIERTVTTSAAPEKVFPYLADFRNATEWDSGTDSCELVSGDGGPGSGTRCLCVCGSLGQRVDNQW